MSRSVAWYLVFVTMKTETWLSRLVVRRGADYLSLSNITRLETRREGNQDPELSCCGAEQEDVLLTGTDLINVIVFVCTVYCVL